MESRLPKKDSKISKAMKAVARVFVNHFLKADEIGIPLLESFKPVRKDKS